MDYVKIFEQFKNNNILIIGDVMLDTYLIGNVDRISPESPFPVVDIIKKENKLGGAANVALNIKALGANPFICSVIGGDQNGNDLEDLMYGQNIPTKYLYRTFSRKTTNKTRIIGNNTQMLRIDFESREDIDSKIEYELFHIIKCCIEENKIDAIIVEDYDKGVITENLLKMLNEIFFFSKPVYVDPKNKNFSSYRNIRIFKPNLNELKRGLKIPSSMYSWETDIKDLYKPIEKMMNDKSMQICYTTMGKDGILVSYSKSKFEKKSISEPIKHIHIQGEKKSVADVSGAGDSVMSISTLLDINGVDKVETARISNIAGGLVCEKVGVVPIDKDELLIEIMK